MIKHSSFTACSNEYSFGRFSSSILVVLEGSFLSGVAYFLPQVLNITCLLFFILLLSIMYKIPKAITNIKIVEIIIVNIFLFILLTFYLSII